MSSWSWKAGLAGVAIVAATAYALAQMAPGHGGMHGPVGAGQDQPAVAPNGMHERMMQMMHGQGMPGGVGGNGMMGHADASNLPTLPGQDAFGAIQEIVRILEADPSTDWSKVNIAALREHLVDMNEVTLNAAAEQRALDNGVEIAVTGSGRTLEAIKRMVPAHVAELVRTGWTAKTEDLANGVKVTVTSADPRQVTKLKALGFMGIMVQGGHHQPHHLMMVRGDFTVH